jgi:hypothetical protein
MDPQITGEVAPMGRFSCELDCWLLENHSTNPGCQKAYRAPQIINTSSEQLTTASVFSLCLLKKLLRAPGLNRQDNHKF